MTREEAVKLIPPGWVECEQSTYLGAYPGWRINYIAGHSDDYLHGRSVYAIPAPKEPRRAEVLVEFNDGGTALSGSCVGDTIRKFIGGSVMNYEAVADSTFRVTIEEVLDEN